MSTFDEDEVTSKVLLGALVLMVLVAAVLTLLITAEPTQVNTYQTQPTQQAYESDNHGTLGFGISPSNGKISPALKIGEHIGISVLDGTIVIIP